MIKTIADAQGAKEKLRASIESAVREFVQATDGLSITRIEIEMVDLGGIGGKPVRVVKDVRVEVEL